MSRSASLSGRALSKARLQNLIKGVTVLEHFRKKYGGAHSAIEEWNFDQFPFLLMDLAKKKHEFQT